MRKAVVERQDDKQNLVLADRNDAGALLHICRVIAVRKQDSLRVSRGTRRITDIGVVIGTHALIAGLEFTGVFFQESIAQRLDFRHPHLALQKRIDVERRIVEHDDLFHFRAFADDGADLRQLVGRDQDPLRVGMMDAEKQVAPLAQVDRERNVHGAGIKRADLRHDPHGAALRKQCDLVALLHAQRHEARTDTVRLQAGLFLGNLFPDTVDLLAKIDVLGELMRVLFYEIDDGWSVGRHMV